MVCAQGKQGVWSVICNWATRLNKSTHALILCITRMKLRALPVDKLNDVFVSFCSKYQVTIWMSSKVVYMPTRDQSHVKYAARAYILGLLMLDIHTLCAPIYLRSLSMGQKYLLSHWIWCVWCLDNKCTSVPGHFLSSFALPCGGMLTYSYTGLRCWVPGKATVYP